MSTQCTTSRLGFDCRASLHPGGSPSIRSPASSSTPSTVLLNSSSTVTLTNSSSVEQVADGRLVLSPPLSTSKLPKQKVDELPENIPSGADLHSSSTESSNEICCEGNQLLKDEANSNLIETVRADSDVKDVNLLPGDSSLGKPEDEGQTVDMKPSVKFLYGSPQAQLEGCDGREKFANPQSKVVHKWSLKLDVNSSFVRNDSGCDDCELDNCDSAVGHVDLTESIRL